MSHGQKADAWWVQVPAATVRAGETIHIVCESAPGAESFRHLEVPASRRRDIPVPRADLDLRAIRERAMCQS